MNSAFLFVVGVAALLAGYFVYGRLLRRKLFPLSQQKPTPAESSPDGVDYVPAKPLVLFGHHFASIAGAGPIVGPLVAVGSWGWLPVFLWLVLGAIFAGGVHDYLALMISVRSGGVSVAEVAENVISRRARWFFAVFVWLALVLVVAVFAIVTAKTLISQPEIVIPTAGLIPLAIVFGIVNYKTKTPLSISTIISLGVLVALLWIGVKVPVAVPKEILGLSGHTFLVLVLFAYALLASVVPVWILLQPRDYLSVWILFFGLFLGTVGIIFVHPAVSAPAFLGFSAKVQGPLWPMLFVVVACGAISGFHSLVASGTTSKQLASERHGQMIGYGGMLMESVLALVALLAVAAGLLWGVKDPNLAAFDFKHLIREKGWIVTFATGFGRIVGRLPLISERAGKLFAMLMLNGFVLTTLDTATRLGRFLFTEIVTGGSPKQREGAWYSNRWIASGVGVALAFVLGSTNSWQAIWPVFGAANQLVAALALLVATSYLLATKKPSSFAALPASFMLATTVGALVYKALSFASTGNYTLFVIAAALVVLAVLMLTEAVRVALRRSER